MINMLCSYSNSGPLHVVWNIITDRMLLLLLIQFSTNPLLEKLDHYLFMAHCLFVGLWVWLIVFFLFCVFVCFNFNFLPMLWKE